MRAQYLNLLYKFFIGFSLVVVSTIVYSEQICQDTNILPSARDARYERNIQGIVMDKNTGLMWRTCTEGTSGSECDTGSAINASWGDALLYVNKVNHDKGLEGFTDWRLPNIRELNSLADVQCTNASINSRIFPNTPAAHFWTSSPYNTLDFYSWYVDFSTGETNTDDRLNAKKIRLVRAGQ